MPMEKILLDTDIGSDIDDAVCLAYLLMQPRCELLGITTVSGQPVERAMLCSAICRAAGKQIPIVPGAGSPMLVEPHQPLAQQAEKLKNWPHDTQFPRSDALSFLRETILANPGEVTLLAIGPMTNVGLLFAAYPEVIPQLKRLVLMCGIFQIGRPGALEWNALNDPHATAIVYNAHPAVHQSYGLDVTTQVVMPAEEVRSRFQHPVLKPVLDFADVWFQQQPHITFHDPLAAVGIFEDVCGFTRGAVAVEATDGRLGGMTLFHADPKGPHEIASSVDAPLFFKKYFEVFA